ncbi:NAD(P)-binding oxidoreductase [Kitasatospora sp. NPDC005751]|uniref:NAD(P)-dependent oxidoreductase n=1 Tax=unclassified Kitasatospora TaxID=2633591 RepID=UPI003403BF74
MKLTILAATGGIGRHLLTQAVAAGHDVTVVVRTPARLADPAGSGRAPAGVRVVRADLAVADPAELQSAVAGSDAVLSGLGARSSAEAGVAWRGTRAVITAMREVGARRLIVVSAAPIGAVPSPARPRPPRHDPGDGFFMRHLAAPLTRAALRTHYADLARMEDEIRAGGLDWTIVRPPRLTDRPLTRDYRTAYGRNLRRGLSVARADVAHCMLGLVDRPDSVHRTVGIAD